MKIVVATRNSGKVREIENELADLNIEFLSLSEFPEIPEISETGSTFSENAKLKAGQVAEATGLPAIADDSGLEVDALNGRPGVVSARFAGDGASDDDNNRKLLEEMKGVPESERTARFRCVIAFAEPGGEIETVEGSCEGLILTEPRGDQGFGYDPLFYCPPLGKTFSEIDVKTKLSESHRGTALKKLRKLLMERDGSLSD